MSGKILFFSLLFIILMIFIIFLDKILASSQQPVIVGILIVWLMYTLYSIVTHKKKKKGKDSHEK